MKIVKKEFKNIDECPSAYQSFKNLDEGESIFFARELEHIKSKSYDIKYPNLKARSLFPMDFETNAGAETITYEQYDQVGIAKIISNYADDLPRADVKGKEFTSKVRTIALAYGYNYDEIQAAKMANKPLPQRKANSAKRGHMVLENKIAFFGDAKHDLQGFFTNPNIQEVSLPADGNENGGTASKLFIHKTGTQMVRDLNAMFTAVHVISKGIETAETLMIPLSIFNLTAVTRMDSGTDTTVLQFFLRNSPHCKEVVWVDECTGSGAGDTDKMVAYRRDLDAVSMEMISEFKQLPVQERNLEYVIPTHQRIGGVIIRYPLSVAFADGL